MVMCSSWGKPNELGNGFIHIYNSMHFYTSFSFSVFWFSSNTSHNILKKTYSSAIKDFNLLLYHIFNSAVRDKVPIFDQKLIINKTKYIRISSLISIAQCAFLWNVIQLKMFGLA